MLCQFDIQMGLVRLQAGLVLHLLAAAPDMPELLEWFHPMPDMRVLAVGLLQARHEPLCKLVLRYTGRRI